jgi:hypothetical protein
MAQKFWFQKPNKQSSTKKKMKTPSTTDGWKFERACIERTNQRRLGVRFPTGPGRWSYDTFDIDLIESPEQLRKTLLKAGVDFRSVSSVKKEQIEFLDKMRATVGVEEKIVTSKPGFRGKGDFILGECLIGTATQTHRWASTARDQKIGVSHGNWSYWRTEVAAKLIYSSYGSVGLMTSLAAPLQSYVRDRISTAPLSETMVINYSGGSTSGKSFAARIIAGTIGSPDSVSNWDFTYCGLEEDAEGHNDLPLVLDDTEKHVDISIDFKKAMRAVTQVIPSGKCRRRSVSVSATLPSLEWTTIGFSTSPKRIEELAKDVGWKRSQGERARWIDVPVPEPEAGGIFDELGGSPNEKLKKSAALIRRMENGIASNYGLLMPRWIELLLKKDLAARVVELCDKFVKAAEPQGQPWESRFARKFGLLYAAGKIATENGLLPWPDDWAWRATHRCHRRALAATRVDQQFAQRVMRRLNVLASDPKTFPKATTGGTSPVKLDTTALGVSLGLDGKQVLAIRDEEFVKHVGGKQVYNAVIKAFHAQGLVLKGQGHANTRQLLVPIKVGDVVIKKPRFLLVDRAKLKTACNPNAAH